MKALRTALPWLALVLLGLLTWRFTRDGSRDSSVKPQVAGKPEIFRESGHARSANSPDEKPASSVSSGTSEVALSRMLERISERFKASSSSQESALILKDLREAIRGANEQVAALAIRDFLKSGADVPTKLPFVVGPEGVMETTPTLRTALLDLLPALDPAAALEVARALMDEKKSPDEFALALRIVAWNDLNGDLKPELSARLTEMLAQGAWRAEPSAGFLEGLDAAVELSDETAFNAMVRAIGENNPALTRASFMALDRMVLRNPELLVDSFNTQPEMPGLSPEQRASLMSRLDLTDPAQREVFTRYLALPTHGPRELDYFANLFPNGNFLHGNWLISRNEPPQTIDSRLAADREAIVQIERLKSNLNIYQTIDRIEKRLIRQISAASVDSKK